MDHLVLMKLQTRVRQMLQLHFSLSKLTAFCVCLTTSCAVSCLPYSTGALQQTPPLPREETPRRGGTGAASGAEEPCTGQGRGAAPLAGARGERSSPGDAVGTESMGGVPTGTFPEPSAGPGLP